MSTHKNKTFSNQQITLDKKAFENCVFQNCDMVYKGGTPPDLVSCRFESCTWTFEDAAQNTVAFLSAIYRGGFKSLVEGTFDKIRTGQLVRPKNS